MLRGSQLFRLLHGDVDQTDADVAQRPASGVQRHVEELLELLVAPLPHFRIPFRFQIASHLLFEFVHNLRPLLRFISFRFAFLPVPAVVVVVAAAVVAVVVAAGVSVDSVRLEPFQFLASSG